ncbi:MAG: cytidylate kinase family protein [Bryobacterales bacterium]|nr:cytidylate kinase family protein [Bryobacterales bacterium]
MAVVTVSGEPGCRAREVAQLAAQRLGYSHISAEKLDTMLAEEFGPVIEANSKAWPDMAASILLRVASRTNLVVGVDGAELLFRSYPAVLRVRVVAPVARRIGNAMLDDRLERAAARQSLTERAAAIRTVRKARFGRATAAPETFDITLNAETLDAAHKAELIEAAVRARGLNEMGFLSPAAEAQLQFRIRLRLAAHGIEQGAPAQLKGAQFGHPSEETFARLLDFYRIAWEYEPRSFPIKWDEQGRVLEAFTPDFFLAESNLYVELTTMKQSLVTKKNRKIRLLREIYPHINIQVFYQKDLQDLVLKYGLAAQAEKSE